MMRFGTAAVQFTLRAYKQAVSPWLPPACRYTPTCSEYAMEAVDRFGVFRGGLMALWRLLHCHPLSKGGYDPVDALRDCAERGTPDGTHAAIGT